MVDVYEVKTIGMEDGGYKHELIYNGRDCPHGLDTEVKQVIDEEFVRHLDIISKSGKKIKSIESRVVFQ